MNSTKIAKKYIFLGAAVLLASMIIFMVIDSFASLFRKQESAPDFNQTYENVSGLDINIGAGVLNIKVGDSFRVEATNIYSDFDCENVDGVLVVKDVPSSYNLSPFSDPTTITVYLPSDFTAKNVHIKTGAGSSVIDRLSSETLSLTMGAGEFTCDNLTANKAKIDGGVGSIKIKNGNLRDLSFSTGVGETEFSGSILGNSTIRCGIGEITLNLNATVDDYNLTTNTGLGEIKIDGKEVSGVNWKNLTAENILKIDGGVGEVEINFSSF